jgi:hypothetical protein
MIALLFLGMTVNALFSIVFKTSAQSMFSFFNIMQLYLILPLLGAFMRYEVINFLVGLSFSLCSFSFLSIENQHNVKGAVDNFNYDQVDPYLNLLGLSSSNTLINLLNICGMLLVFSSVHPLFILLKW